MTPQGAQVLATGTTLLAQGAAANPSISSSTRSRTTISTASTASATTARSARSRPPRTPRRASPGIDDLDAYGRWVTDGGYGRVWVPATVASTWAPYRDGRWVWEEGYGWTWLGYEPWGWAPYHYGRWYHSSLYGWCWYPERSFIAWRPAVVAFLGFGGGFGFGNIGWVPLAPYETFYPWWGNRLQQRDVRDEQLLRRQQQRRSPSPPRPGLRQREIQRRDVRRASELRRRSLRARAGRRPVEAALDPSRARHRAGGSDRSEPALQQSSRSVTARDREHRADRRNVRRQHHRRAAHAVRAAARSVCDTAHVRAPRAPQPAARARRSARPGDVRHDDHDGAGDGAGDARDERSVGTLRREPRHAGDACGRARERRNGDDDDGDCRRQRTARRTCRARRAATPKCGRATVRARPAGSRDATTALRARTTRRSTARTAACSRGAAAPFSSIPRRPRTCIRNIAPAAKSTTPH